MLLSFKCIVAVIIFLLAMISGLVPLYIGDRHPRIFCLFEAIASGIFLGASLFHMLPESEYAFRQVGLNNFPFAIAFMVLGFILLFVIQRTVRSINGVTQAKLITAVLLTLMLSVHALIAGVALGIATSVTNALIILTAILAHKSSASFALGVSLRRGISTFPQQRSMLMVFASMTPIGVVSAAFLVELVTEHTGIVLAGIFNALAAGTFIYIGMMELIDKQLHGHRIIHRFWEFCALLVGMMLMAVLAVWI